MLFGRPIRTSPSMSMSASPSTRGGMEVGTHGVLARPPEGPQGTGQAARVRGSQLGQRKPPFDPTSVVHALEMGAQSLSRLQERCSLESWSLARQQSQTTRSGSGRDLLERLRGQSWSRDDGKSSKSVLRHRRPDVPVGDPHEQHPIEIPTSCPWTHPSDTAVPPADRLVLAPTGGGAVDARGVGLPHRSAWRGASRHAAVVEHHGGAPPAAWEGRGGGAAARPGTVRGQALAQETSGHVGDG